MSAQQFDFAVVGAGIAGASVAWALSASARVLLLERETQPGYHATGRSAAAFIPSYGFQNPALRTLTLASTAFFEQPPDGFATATLLHKRGLLTIAPDKARRTLTAEHDALVASFPDVQLLHGNAVQAQLPGLRTEAAAHALFEPGVFDIDVDALHQGYLRGLKQQGGQLLCAVNISALHRTAGSYQMTTNRGVFEAPVVVNSCGAWTDELAALAGVSPIGLQPMRRTAVRIDPPPGMAVDDWPLLLARDESFYAKPDAGALLVSPADEHPSAPVDAQPEELDIAYAVHHAQQALQIDEPRVRQSWAGLRCFVADRTPVIGADPDHPGFFWLCGQGGHGIQTAPAASQLAAAMLLGDALPAAQMTLGMNPNWVAPERLRVGARGEAGR